LQFNTAKLPIEQQLWLYYDARWGGSSVRDGMQRSAHEEEHMSTIRPYWRLSASATFCLAACIALLSIHGRAAESQRTEPVQTPITGNEDLGDLSQPQQALAQFYHGFNTRDLKMIDENFAHSNEIAIDNPLGGIRRGADEPHKLYEAVFKSAANVHVEFWDYTIDRAGDVFWAVGRERGTYHDGDAEKNLNIRTTRIFQMINGRWRQMHHHGSIEDARLLGDYQSAVRSAPSRTQ
jgi:ketosteroid isomerase-like protein